MKLFMRRPCCSQPAHAAWPLPRTQRWRCGVCTQHRAQPRSPRQIAAALGLDDLHHGPRPLPRSLSRVSSRAGTWLIPSGVQSIGGTDRGSRGTTSRRITTSATKADSGKSTADEMARFMRPVVPVSASPCDLAIGRCTLATSVPTSHLLGGGLEPDRRHATAVHGGRCHVSWGKMRHPPIEEFGGAQAPRRTPRELTGTVCMTEWIGLAAR
jgi:hypothetical protein